MSKFNTATHTPKRGKGLTGTRKDGVTHSGVTGYKKDAKSALFIAATTSFIEPTFYGEDPKAMLKNTARMVAVKDPEWFGNFTKWLRAEGNMRSSAVLVAVHGAKAMINAGVPGARQVISNVILRADEPAEVLAAWTAEYGRTVPSAVKRGISDAVNRVWNEYSVAKYNGSGAYTMRDVMNLTHPKMNNKALASYIIDSAYGNETDLSALPMLSARADFLAMSDSDKRKFVLSGKAAAAGLTWEVVSSVMGKPGAEVWEAMLPQMGYMARLRSIKRLEEAGVSGEVLDDLAKYLADPKNVAKSRQFPLAFLAAFRGASMRFSWPLEQAVTASLANIDSLPGRTLVMVDRSGSMFASLSERSSLSREDAACIFGAAIALRAENATYVEFATSSKEIALSTFKGSVLKATEQHGISGGTNTTTAIREHYRGHSRVIVITDDQTYDGNPGDAVPANIPMYVWNLNSYSRGAFATGENRYEFGGLTDASFNTIKMIEAGKDAKWPWE